MKKAILVITLSALFMISYFALPMQKPAEMVQKQAEFNLQYTLAKTINSAEFTDDQLQLIYDGAAQTRDKLEALKQTITDLKNSALDYIIAGDVEASEKTLADAKTEAQKASEIISEFNEIVKRTVTVDQLEKMMPEKATKEEMISQLKEKYEQLSEEQKELLNQKVKSTLQNVRERNVKPAPVNNLKKIKNEIQKRTEVTPDTMLNRFSGILISDAGFEILGRYVTE